MNPALSSAGGSNPTVTFQAELRWFAGQLSAGVNNCLQSLLDAINVRLRCRGAGFGIVLKRMQHVNRISHSHCVDGMQCIAAMTTSDARRRADF